MIQFLILHQINNAFVSYDTACIIYRQPAKIKLPTTARTAHKTIFETMSDSENIYGLIKKLSPLMAEDSEVFQELAIYFGDGAKVHVDRSDLSKFLGRKRLYRVIRLVGESYKDCAYQLIDDHPEALEALGMLRYYKAPDARIQWAEIEAAEIAMGKELTMNAYGWAPDAWTAFEGDAPNNATDSDGAENSGKHQLTAIIAFDFGE